MNLRVEDAGKNGGSLVTVSLPEDPLGVLPELPEEDLPEDFRKKGLPEVTHSGRSASESVFRKNFFRNRP